MDPVEITLTLVVLGISLALFFAAYRFLTKFIPFVNDVFNFVTWPIRKISQLVRAQSEEHTPRLIPKSLDAKFSAFGGVVTFFLFAASAIFVVVVFIVEICITKNAGDTLERIIFNTTMGAFLALFDEGFSFSPANLVAVGFSGFLASTCMSRADNVKWYVWVPYCTIFIAMSAIVASFLAGIFEIVGNWGLESIEMLNKADNTSIFSLVGRSLALIVLAYFALVLIVMTAREYYACVCFGPLSMAIFTVATTVIHYLWGDPNYTGPGFHWTEYLMLLAMYASIILVEYFRQDYDNKSLLPKRSKPTTTPAP